MKRAVTYSRVSTKRQAEHESSLEDQQATTVRYIEREGMTFVDSYVDGGASGMTDRRPEFQRMIADAVAKPKRFDVIVVLNYSRFMREDHIFEVYRRKLEKAGVELVSATQNLGSGIYGDLTRKIVAAVDAASSEINASQVRAMMVKNATDGYWNGSRPPLGYRTYVAGRRDKKDKKKLEIDPVEAAQYLDIVDRYLGRSGHPDVGVARLAADLNALGLRHRSQQFSPALVHSILTREIYVGRHYYNTVDSRSRDPRPREEWILVAVPPIIDEDTFAAIKQRLASRDPNMAAARSHSTPVMLSGVAKCGCCGTSDATMMLMTGKGGDYRYYACSRRRRKKEIACGGNNVPMQRADDIVLDALEKRLFQPKRLRTLLNALLERSDKAIINRTRQLAALRAELTANAKATRNLMMLVESGAMEATDPDLKARLADHKARRLHLDKQIADMEKLTDKKIGAITNDQIERFAAAMREKLRDKSDPELRKRYVRAFVSEVSMSRERIVIRGPKAALSGALLADSEDPPSVRTSVSEWRTRRDSNPRPPD